MTADISALDWPAIEASLAEHGYATTPPFLDAGTCDELRRLYDDPATSFRSTINMARYNFGSGEYKYFDYPLPDLVAKLRSNFYARLAPVANAWARALRMEADWPGRLDELCAEAMGDSAAFIDDKCECWYILITNRNRKAS